MARLVYGDLDLVGNLLKDFRVDPLDAPPAGAGEGRLYYNTVDDALYVFNGTVWEALADGADVDALEAALAAETAAREAADNTLTADKADKTVNVTAGNGLTGGGTLAGDVALSVQSEDGSISVLSTGLAVNVGRGITKAEGVGDIEVNTGEGLVILDDAVSVNQQWLADQIEANAANNIQAGNGIEITEDAGAGGADVIAAKVSGNTGNALTVDNTGLFVPTPAATDLTDYYTKGEVDSSQAAQDAVTATKADKSALDAEAAARLAADVAQQNLLDAEVTARQSGDADLGARIDGISITGTGVATVTEASDKQFTVDVPSLQLAETYTGDTGVDSGTINAEIAPAVGHAGDLYINTASGSSFINTGLPALPDGADWVALATAEAGLNVLNPADPSVEITNGGGPVATIKVSTTVQNQIAANASKNIQQDARLDNAESKNTAQDTRLTNIEGVNDAQNGRLDANEAKDLVQDSDIANLKNVGSLFNERLNEVEDVNAVQSGLISINTAKNVDQDSKIAAIETKNAEQDAAIAAINTSSHPAATSGSGAIAVDSATSQKVSLVIDGTSTSGVVSQGSGGLKVDTSQYATKANLDAEADGRLAADQAQQAALTAEALARTTADATKADKATSITAGAGLAGGGDLSTSRDLSIGAGAGIAVGENDVSVDTAWLDPRIAANSLQPTEVLGANGVSASVDSGTGTVLLSAVAQANGGIVVTAGGISVDPNFASDQAPVQSVSGVAGEILVTAGPNPVVGIEAAYTAATDGKIAAGDAAVQDNLDAEVTARGEADQDLQDALNAEIALRQSQDGLLQTAIASEQSARQQEDARIEGLVTDVASDLAAEITDRTNADTALSDRISAVSVSGTGMATVTEAGENVFTVDVPAVQLANTYTGVGTNAAEINADLAGRDPVVVPQAGDLYVNEGDGSAFLATSAGADASWTELQAAVAAITSVTAADDSVTIPNPTGPAVTVKVSDDLQAKIETATSTNDAQDDALEAQSGRLDALEAIDHVAAVGVQAVKVDPGTQAVSLALDATGSDELSQTDAGLKIDLSQYAKTTDVQVGDEFLTLNKADKVTQVIAGKGLQGGGTLAGDVTIDIGVTPDSGLVIDDHGIWINDGAAIETNAEGINVRFADGLSLGGDGDQLVVVGGTGIIVDENGVSIDTAGLVGATKKVAYLDGTNGSNGSYTIQHDLGEDVSVTLYDGGREIWAEVTVGANDVSITSNPALPLNTKVVILA